jgi:hypothetical protein
MQAQFGFLGRYSPVERLRAPLRAAYEKAAAQALDPLDWEKAELCLARALELGASGADITGKLALARGYVALRSGQRESASNRFQEAARNMPQSPDPHLGLARANLQASRPGDALDELAAAERLGYRLGPPEIGLKAEACRLRGFEELQAGNLTAARQDFAVAHGLNGALQVPDIPPAPAPRKTVHKPRPRRWR